MVTQRSISVLVVLDGNLLAGNDNLDENLVFLDGNDNLLVEKNNLDGNLLFLAENVLLLALFVGRFFHLLVGPRRKQINNLPRTFGLLVPSGCFHLLVILNLINRRREQINNLPRTFRLRVPNRGPEYSSFHLFIFTISPVISSASCFTIFH